MLYNLLNIKKDLSQHHRDKSTLKKFYVDKRLNDSLNSYYKTLEMSVNYLYNRQPENVAKEL